MNDDLTALRNKAAEYETGVGKKPTRILMSKDSHSRLRLLLAPTVNHAKSTTWPETVDGFRVVLDDSLPIGEFLAA